MTEKKKETSKENSAEFAEMEFDRFADAMDLDLDVSKMNEEDKASLIESKEKVLSRLCSGSLVINGDGEPVFTPQRSADKKPIVFYEPTGASMLAMDMKKSTADNAKTFAFLADCTQTNQAVFSSMKMGDLKVCQALMMLFVG